MIDSQKCSELNNYDNIKKIARETDYNKLQYMFEISKEFIEKDVKYINNINITNAFDSNSLLLKPNLFGWFFKYLYAFISTERRISS